MRHGTPGDMLWAHSFQDGQTGDQAAASAACSDLVFGKKEGPALLEVDCSSATACLSQCPSLPAMPVDIYVVHTCNP